MLARSSRKDNPQRRCAEDFSAGVTGGGSGGWGSLLNVQIESADFIGESRKAIICCEPRMALAKSIVEVLTCPVEEVLSRVWTVAVALCRYISDFSFGCTMIRSLSGTIY